jgi:hypothetical protein
LEVHLKETKFCENSIFLFGALTWEKPQSPRRWCNKGRILRLRGSSSYKNCQFHALIAKNFDDPSQILGRPVRKSRWTAPLIEGKADRDHETARIIVDALAKAHGIPARTP